VGALSLAMRSKEVEKNHQYSRRHFRPLQLKFQFSSTLTKTSRSTETLQVKLVIVSTYKDENLQYQSRCACGLDSIAPSILAPYY
jgi:hypothetical protein